MQPHNPWSMARVLVLPSRLANSPQPAIVLARLGNAPWSMGSQYYAVRVSRRHRELNQKGKKGKTPITRACPVQHGPIAKRRTAVAELEQEKRRPAADHLPVSRARLSSET